MTDDPPPVEFETREIGFSVKPRVIIYGPVCACGHVVTGAARTQRRAKARHMVRRVAHRLRHPFRERTPFAEWLDDSPEDIKAFGEFVDAIAEDPTRLWGEWSPGYDIDGPELYPDGFEVDADEIAEELDEWYQDWHRSRLAWHRRAP